MGNEEEYQLCRVCLCKTKSSISLKASSEKEYIYMFNMCTRLDAVVNDELPQHLCTSCSNNLVTAFDFFQLARDSDCKLKQSYEAGSRQTRSGGCKLKFDQHLNKDDFNDVNESSAEKNRGRTMQGNTEVESIYARDPLEETDDEIDVNPNIAVKNTHRYSSKEDIWSGSDSVNKISSDVEDEDDKPLGELIKSAKTLQMKNKEISKDNDVYNEHFNVDENQCNSPSESLLELNASPEEQLFPQGRYKCKICEKSYFTTVGLKVHITIHLPKKTKTKTKSRGPNKKRNKAITIEEEVVSKDLKDVAIKCDQIEAEEDINIITNARKRKLPKPKKMFPCHVCGKHMISASKLRYHMVMHTGEKDYLCTICPKAYSTIYALKHHMRTHTGERPYECKFCGDKFTRPTTLKSHMRRHTGERPYGCDICGKRFIQHSSMTTHMKLNHMAKTIPCPHCEKKYARQTDLTTHLLSHTGDKPFSCQLCPSRFIRQANLNKHMNQHHTDKSNVPSSKETKKLQKVAKKVVMASKAKCTVAATEDTLGGTKPFNQSSGSISSIEGSHVSVSTGLPLSTPALPSIFSSNINTLIELNRLSTHKTRLPNQVQTDHTQQIFGQVTNIIEPERLGCATDDVNHWSWSHTS